MTRPPGPALRRVPRLAAGAVALCLIAACSGGGLPAAFTGGGNAGLTEAQACAVGYDLAREIHGRVAPRRTVLLAPARRNACERHALEYLRRAGFRIDETGRGGVGLSVTVDRTDGGDVAAVAEIGGSLRIARMYTPVRTGARAASAVTVQRLDPDTYIERGAGW